jgi:hypothetical protein
MLLDKKALLDVILKKSVSLKESDINKYERLFARMPVDLIYTFDGALAYSLKYDDTNSYRKRLDAKDLGCEKKFFKHIELPVSDPIAYNFDYRLDRQDSALGIVITYIYYWCSNLVKCSPKMHVICDKYLKDSFS